MVMHCTGYLKSGKQQLMSSSSTSVNGGFQLPASELLGFFHCFIESEIVRVSSSASLDSNINYLKIKDHLRLKSSKCSQTLKSIGLKYKNIPDSNYPNFQVSLLVSF